MEYQVVITKSVKKELAKIDNKYRSKIFSAFFILRNNPYLGKKLKGKLKDRYTYRVWPLRIIYEIEDKELIVLIIRIGQRQGVYR